MKNITVNTIEALCNGNHDAFDAVFIAYYNKIKNFINGLIRSESDAEELAQDVFVRLWMNRNSIDPDKAFNSYMYTMARNAAFNYIKHQSVHDTYVSNYTTDLEITGPEEIIYAKEIALLIEMSVERMPAQRKKIFQLSRYEGLTNEEIAQQLNITKKTVENQLSLALKELRNIITYFLLFFNISDQFFN